MGLKDLFFGDDNSEARIDSLISTNYKVTNMLELTFKTHADTVNKLLSEYQRLNNEIQELTKSLGAKK